MKTLLTSFSLAFLLSPEPAALAQSSATTTQAVGTSGAAARDPAATAKVPVSPDY